MTKGTAQGVRPQGDVIPVPPKMSYVGLQSVTRPFICRSRFCVAASKI